MVIDFWTFECYNCLNALPYVKSLENRFRDQGVVVLGIHTPELARERVRANVVDAVQRLSVTYPVALDNNYTIWNAFRNQYWPAVYIVDKNGRIRYHHSGEGSYAEQEHVVQQLLASAALDRSTSTVHGHSRAGDVAGSSRREKQDCFGNLCHGCHAGQQSGHTQLLQRVTLSRGPFRVGWAWQPRSLPRTPTSANSVAQGTGE